MTLRMAALAGMLAACAVGSGCAGLLSFPEHGGSGVNRARAAPGGTAVVRPGDTLYSIAFRNNLDFRQLAAWNGIGPDYRIYPGQRLRLGPPSRSVRRPAARPAPVVTAEASPPSFRSSPVPMPGSSRDAPPPGGRTFDSRRWLWPTAGPVVHRFDPADGQKGIDIAGRLGQTVVAAAPGRVVYSGNALKGYGELVIVEHDSRYLSAYGYNRRRLVEEGQSVRAGQPIAELGEGPEQKPELHFEIRIEGKPVDPLDLLPPR